MVRNGFKYVDETNNNFRLIIENNHLHRICGTKDVCVFIKDQQRKFLAHVVRMDVERNVKLLNFNDDKCVKRGRPVKSLLEQVTENLNMTVDAFCTMALKRNY